jgi:cell division protein FtsZ
MEGARSILLSITGGRDISLWEVNEAAKAVAEAAHPDANIIFGAMVDDKLGDDQVWVTVVATGYGDPPSSRRQAERPAIGSSSRPADRERVSLSEREPRRPMREPQGEPRVTRGRDRTYATTDLDVPEFIPRR